MLGEVGRNEGQIMTNWIHIDAVAEDARFMRRSLDWGYTNDPTAIFDVYEYNGGYVLDEVCYEKSMGNGQIADRCQSC